jgi:ELWxxDGT repeat protein
MRMENPQLWVTDGTAGGTAQLTTIDYGHNTFLGPGDITMIATLVCHSHP